MGRGRRRRLLVLERLGEVDGVAEVAAAATGAPPARGALHRAPGVTRDVAGESLPFREGSWACEIRTNPC